MITSYDKPLSQNNEKLNFLLIMLTVTLTVKNDPDPLNPVLSFELLLLTLGLNIKTETVSILTQIILYY